MTGALSTYFMVTTTVLWPRSSVPVATSRMKPSALRMCARLSLSLECGETHTARPAFDALRRWVRKSLIGSVMDGCWLDCPSDHIRLPAGKCLPGGLGDARDLAGERELAERDAGDAETAVEAARPAAERAAVADADPGGIARELRELLLGGEELVIGRRRVGEDGLQLGALGGVLLDEADALLVAFDGGGFRHGRKRLGGGGRLGGGRRIGAAERHAQELEELAGLVVGLGGGDKGDVEAHRALVVLDDDLGEDGEVGDADGVVALAIELVGHAAKIADGGQRHGEQAHEEVPHVLAAAGDVAAGDLGALQLEVGEGR